MSEDPVELWARNYEPHPLEWPPTQALQPRPRYRPDPMSGIPQVDRELALLQRHHAFSASHYPMGSQYLGATHVYYHPPFKTEDWER